MMSTTCLTRYVLRVKRCHVFVASATTVYLHMLCAAPLVTNERYELKRDSSVLRPTWMIDDKLVPRYEVAPRSDPLPITT